MAAVALPLVLPSAHLDSTNAFALPALLACLLMVRLVRRPPERLLDARLVALGLAIGVAGLARNEAAWVGLAWALVAFAAWRRAGLGPVVRAIAVPGLIAVAVMAPWLVRNWLVFGSPLPGQAITNAWAITGYEIFAWQDPATAADYLALGPAAWLQHRVDGFLHNLLDVLLVPGAPIAVVGLVALPWAARLRALRPLLVLALITFLVTTLVFPVQTRWGTFLHASVPAAVLLAGGRPGRPGRGPRVGGPAARLDAPGGVAGAPLRGLRRPPVHGAGRHRLRRPGAGHGGRVRGPGAPDGGGGRPPRRSGARHRQPPDLARRGPPRRRPWPCPTSRWRAWWTSPARSGRRLVILDGDHGGWPGRLASDPDAACLEPVALPPPADGAAGGDGIPRLPRGLPVSARILAAR